jgi:hypothetical protein
MRYYRRSISPFAALALLCLVIGAPIVALLGGWTIVVLAALCVAAMIDRRRARR